ncbi:hypothetical protein SH1V18_04000 [Vallitalea longa]|uniref:Uncharacterized protein n=1 Tax=Vallitalea longa TaxID=2936439 RepID=A0A9W5Y8I2_9FIRM|nr:hypothetical protein [Vallitalea longa]GKX27920.1 hypothetical protein SH1V18_04000 [Vallitalea longa]
MLILISIFLGLIAFIVILILTELITVISGCYGDIELFAICLVGAIIISCTFIVIAKLDDLKNSKDESKEDLL